MFKRLIAKGNIHRSDYLRALVTDTIPGDIPIIISNDGFYKNAKAFYGAKSAADLFTEKLLTKSKGYTRPYRYNIMRPGNAARRLSLLHPASQIEVAEFYRSSGVLICYFCRKSPASIRSPKKVGSLFFVRGPVSEKNKIKGSRIDTVDIEHSVSNPASYFSYKGYDRAFKFFGSQDYLRMEKRYSVMHFADVSKCFNSIYTHTLYWAICDVNTAKENNKAYTFSNSFDKIMQSMNYNETNGICVGAEVSRIFAELILSEVDRRTVERLSGIGLSLRTDYEFRRYVDDYYIFSTSDDNSKKVLAALSSSLGDFNLHLNERKTERVPRPFITVKSRSIRDVNKTAAEFFDKFLTTDIISGKRVMRPKRVWKPSQLLRFLLESVKSSCFDHESGYELSANYIIGALASRIDVLVSDYEAGIQAEGVSDDDYIGAIMLMLEATYFFYNVHPSVPSSLRVAQAAILSADFIAKHIPDRLPLLAEQIVRWTFEFVRSLNGSTSHRDAECVPLEALNILLVLGEVGQKEALAQQAISEFCRSVKSLQYFEIVSFLFCMRSEAGYSSLRDELFDQGRALIFDGLGVQVDAQAAHLAVDLLSCPHIDEAKRVTLYQDLRAHLGLAAASMADAQAAVSAYESNPWFVDWREANLLSLIRKKELSAVY